METPDEISPYSLLQEEIRLEGRLYWEWRMLVVCMMLNQTSAKQVRNVMGAFFDEWDSPLWAGAASRYEMAEVIKSLGLQHRRAKSIIRMSRRYHELMSDRMSVTEHLEDLCGVGKYAADSWYLFVYPRFIKDDVEDKELKNYVKWAKERS